MVKKQTKITTYIFTVMLSLLLVFSIMIGSPKAKAVHATEFTGNDLTGTVWVFDSDEAISISDSVFGTISHSKVDGRYYASGFQINANYEYDYYDDTLEHYSGSFDKLTTSINYSSQMNFYTGVSLVFLNNNTQVDGLCGGSYLGANLTNPYSYNTSGHIDSDSDDVTITITGGNDAISSSEKFNTLVSWLNANATWTNPPTVDTDTPATSTGVAENIVIASTIIVMLGTMLVILTQNEKRYEPK